MRPATAHHAPALEAFRAADRRSFQEDRQLEIRLWDIGDIVTLIEEWEAANI